MDEQDWVAFRKQARTRTSRLMALIICPLIVILALVKIAEPMDYPVGDLRNSIEFRFVFYGLFIVFALAAIIASARWLLADRRR